MTKTITNIKTLDDCCRYMRKLVEKNEKINGGQWRQQPCPGGR